jgi:type III secretory pathway component EscV
MVFYQRSLCSAQCIQRKKTDFHVWVCIPCGHVNTDVYKLADHQLHCIHLEQIKANQVQVQARHDEMKRRNNNMKLLYLPKISMLRDSKMQCEVQNLCFQYLLETETPEAMSHETMEMHIESALNKECIVSLRLGIWKQLCLMEHEANFSFASVLIGNHEDYKQYVKQEKEKWKVYKNNIFMSHHLKVIYKNVLSFLL